MNWGKSIVVAFILFTLFIAILVTVCVREDISLVTKEYYQEELVYQKQIDRISQTARLSVKPTIAVEPGNLVKVSYSDLHKVQEGTLKLFRPSDKSMDKAFKLENTTTSDALYFSTAGMRGGMYRARLNWSMGGEEFFLEQVINL